MKHVQPVVKNGENLSRINFPLCLKKGKIPKVNSFLRWDSRQNSKVARSDLEKIYLKFLPGHQKPNRKKFHSIRKKMSEGAL